MPLKAAMFAVCGNALLDTAAQSARAIPPISSSSDHPGVLPKCYFGHLAGISYIKCRSFKARRLLHSGSRRDFFKFLALHTPFTAVLGFAL